MWIKKKYKKTKDSIITTKNVKKNVVSRYVILSLEKKNNYFTIKDVVEKPSLKNSPSNYSIVWRYILPKTIMS